MATTSRPPVLEMTRSVMTAPRTERERHPVDLVGPWRYYIDGREVGEHEYRAEEAKWRQPHPIG
jgi:hypothetical protein